jgi:arylamine N-acetyltransferase
LSGPITQNADILDQGLHREGTELFYSHFSLAKQRPDLVLLETILAAFSRLPYENISKIIKHGREESMSMKLRLPFEVMEDHARFRLGGTCFSLTFFLQTILSHSGFLCYPVMADMRSGPNTHCAIVVSMESKPVLVDPGYLLNRPMEMNSARPRAYDSEHTGVELVFHRDRRTHDLYTFNRDQMKWRYRFMDRPVPPAEFLGYWQSSFSWNSMHGLCLTKAERGRMVYIHKTHMRETTTEGKRNFNLKRNLHRTVSDVFGIPEEMVEAALVSIDLNMKREREQGLWVPRGKKQGPRKTDLPADTE